MAWLEVFLHYPYTSFINRHKWHEVKNKTPEVCENVCGHREGRFKKMDADFVRSAAVPSRSGPESLRGAPIDQGTRCA